AWSKTRRGTSMPRWTSTSTASSPCCASACRERDPRSRPAELLGQAELFLPLQAPGADQAVGGDADEGDAETGDQAAAGVGIGQGLVDLLAQIAGADEGG